MGIRGLVETTVARVVTAAAKATGFSAGRLGTGTTLGVGLRTEIWDDRGTSTRPIDSDVDDVRVRVAGAVTKVTSGAVMVYVE